MKPTRLSQTMHNVPLPVADAIFTWSNIILVIGAVLAVLGTVGVFWSTGIRERYADQRIAANEAETAKAKAEAAQAIETAAALEKEAAEAKLQTEVLRASLAPRRLSKDDQAMLAEALSGFSGQTASTWYGAGDKEAEIFCREIANSLNAAKWAVFAPASSVTMAGSGIPYGRDSNLETGVIIVSTPDDRSKSASAKLVAILNQLGFDARVGNHDNRQGHVVIITVEPRPEGAQGKAKLSMRKDG